MGKFIFRMLLSLSFLLSFSVLADVEEQFLKIDVPLAEQVRMLPLTDNNEAWLAKWQILSEAKESIYADFYMLGKDIYAKAFLGLLLKKAEEGVEINLMSDALASAAAFGYGIPNDYLQELVRYPNVKVRMYNRLAVRSAKILIGDIKDAITSNHHKILVVDRKYCITGGRNIGGDYYADPLDDPKSWRDSDIFIESEVAAKDFIETAFLREFENSKGIRKVHKDLINFSSKRAELLASENVMRQWVSTGEIDMSQLSKGKFLKKMKNAAEDMMAFKQLAAYEQKFNVFSSATIVGDAKVLNKLSHRNKEQDNDITNNIISMIDATEKELVIQNPYVVLTEEMSAALKRAHDRGVEIILHTNSPLSTDSLQTQAFFIDQWKQYMKELPQMRIFAFVKTRKMHSKVWVFDGKVSVVGSYNLDPLSQNINAEIVGLVKSQEASERILTAIELDIQDSLELTNDLNIRENSPFTMANVDMQKKIRKTLKFKKFLAAYI